MDTWQTGTPLRETIRKHAGDSGQRVAEARLDEAFRPERYTERLAAVFERLERLS
jgi:adenylosuccinate lyase